MAGLATALQLGELITSSLATLSKICESSKLDLPNLDDNVFDPRTEAFRANPEADEACRLIAAAGIQLAMSLLPPGEAIFENSTGHKLSATMRVAVEGSVSEVLREAGPKGLHVTEIGRKTSLEPKRLGRILRYLATHHIYREIEPDVFVNNRLSSILDTGKAHSDIIANPGNKHDNTMGIAALLCRRFDEAVKSGAYLWEYLSDDSIPKSGRESKAPFNVAHGEDGFLWQWYEKPENTLRQKTFGIGMQGVARLQPPDAVLKAYDWDDLADNSTVVDVGGGVGSSSLPLAKAYPSLKITIQDRPDVVQEGMKYWEEHNKEALSSQQVSFRAHDFMTPQPIQSPSVFLLKQILHDWSDEWCLTILSHLRAAAGPETKLLIIDSLIPYACPIDETKVTIPGAAHSPPPAPLLANGGLAHVGIPMAVDIGMMLLVNAQDRTVLQFDELLKKAGWKIVRVRKSNSSASFLQPIEAVPI